jgi:hypothetical protein
VQRVADERQAHSRVRLDKLQQHLRGSGTAAGGAAWVICRLRGGRSHGPQLSCAYPWTLLCIQWLYSAFSGHDNGRREIL